MQGAQRLEHLVAVGAQQQGRSIDAPIMIDGTGMCGGCRLSVGGEMKFACVDGPDFDGHKVDFDEVIARNATYKDFEAKAKEKHLCRLGGGAMNG